MGGGTQGNMIHIFQFANDQVFRFNKFELDVQSKTNVLQSKSVVVTKLYGVLYCLHADTSAKRLVMYRVYKDFIAKVKHSIQLFSDAVALSVVDNVIIIHNLDTKLSMIYDTKVPKYPFVSPLPLTCSEPTPLPSTNQDTQSPFFGVPPHNDKLELYKSKWRFISPATVLDPSDGYAWKISLDLEEICSSFMDPLSLIAFLMHRTGAMRLILEVLKSMVLQPRHTLTAIANAFDLINASYVEAIKQRNEQERTMPEKATARDRESSDLNDSIPDLGDDSGPTVVVPRAQSVPDQGDIFTHVFMALRDKPGLQDRVLACVRVCILSLHRHLIQVSPVVFDLFARLLAKCDKLHQLDLCIRFNLIEDSMGLAHTLLELDAQHASAFTLGLDMLHRLNQHDEILKVLLERKKILAACNFVRKMRVTQSEPRPFLSLAWASGDLNLFFTVYNFFAQRNWVVRGNTEFTEQENCDEFVERYNTCFAKTDEEDLF